MQVGPFLLCKLDFSDTAAGEIPGAGFSRGCRRETYRLTLSCHIGNQVPSGKCGFYAQSRLR